MGTNIRLHAPTAAILLAALAGGAEAQSANGIARPWPCWAMSAGGSTFHDARVTSGCGTSPDPAPSVSPAPLERVMPVTAPRLSGPPTALKARVSARRVILAWTPPAGSAPTSYVLEAGSASGLSNLANVSTGSARPLLAATHVPPGRYAMRVRAVTASQTSEPSNEVLFTVGTPAACTGAPDVPQALAASVNRTTVTLSWRAPSSGSPTSYVVQAGSTQGASNLATVDTLNTNVTFTAAAPSGTYYVRVRGRNACGDSAASNEVVVVLATCSLPNVPTGLNATPSGSTVTVNWNTASGATSYTVLAGSSSGTANLAAAPAATNTLTASGIGAGTYFLRVTASNSCGTSAPSGEIVMVVGGAAGTSTWQPLRASMPAYPLSPLLLTDGSVMVVSEAITSSTTWTVQAWRLTPDAFGSYVNGTWTYLSAFPSGYAPLYFASAVLADGRVVIAGGEYNGSSNHAVWTNLGYVYNSATNSYVSLAPPSGWAVIGDSPSTVLPDGRLLLGDLSTLRTALLAPTTLTWSPGATRRDWSSEAGYTLLQDGSVFSVDVAGSGSGERYLPANDQWVSAGTAPISLTASGEIGPQVLRPDGTVFVAGATGHTAIYTPPTGGTGTGTWIVGPDFPTTVTGQLIAWDGPACLLPSGNVLISVAGDFSSPVYFFEFDGTRLINVNGPASATGDLLFLGRLLMLPTGQVLYTGGVSPAIYNPLGSPNPAWAPRITSAPSSVTRGQTYQVAGTQFNGMSQAVAYGDDYQAATNYPLVRITMRATGHVFYARTHDHSTMGVATGTATVSTSFDVPSSIETGAADLVVVANGIPSESVAIVVS
jgi:hypothetical protein